MCILQAKLIGYSIHKIKACNTRYKLQCYNRGYQDRGSPVEPETEKWKIKAAGGNWITVLRKNNNHSIRTRFPVLRDVVVVVAATPTLSSPSLVPRVPSRSRLERLLRRNDMLVSSRPIEPRPVPVPLVLFAF